MTKAKKQKFTEAQAIAAVNLLERYRNSEIELGKTDLKIYVNLIHLFCERSLYFFACYILHMDLLTKRTHKKWADDLQKRLLKQDNFLFLKPRGTYKTTLYGEAFMLWVWAFISPQIRIFYTSCNSTLIGEVSSHLDTFLDPANDSLYYYIFGIGRDASLTNTTETFNVIGKNKNKKGHSLALRPSGGKTAGIHPDLIIVDDPLDNEDRESPAIRQKKKRWFDTLAPLLNGIKIDGKDFAKLLVIGTRWHMDDLFNYIIKMNKDIKTPSDQFSISVESIYDEQGKPSYPEFFPESKIEQKRSKTTSVFFACQYINNPLPDGLQVFQKDKLHFLPIEMIDIQSGVNYTFLDWSRGKIKSDYPATIFVNKNFNRIVIYDDIEKKIRLDDLLKIIAQRNKIDNVKCMYFEETGSTLILETLERLHLALKHPIKIIPIKHNTNKELRIESMEPTLYSGKVFFRDDYELSYPELMNQLTFYPVWANDDFPDVIETAISELIENEVDMSNLYEFQRGL